MKVVNARPSWASRAGLSRAAVGCRAGSRARSGGMYDLLKGLTVVEAAAFIAGPTSGLYLAQFGARVIRIDQLGGGPDFRRWPLAPNGESLYWEGLNKAKQSVMIDLARPEGREL